jgi:hypothetical protein
MSFRMIRTPWSRVVWGPCLLGKRACPGPQRSGGRGVCGLSLVLQTPPPPGSHRCPVDRPVARSGTGQGRRASRRCLPRAAPVPARRRCRPGRRPARSRSARCHAGPVRPEGRVGAVVGEPEHAQVCTGLGRGGTGRGEPLPGFAPLDGKAPVLAPSHVQRVWFLVRWVAIGGPCACADRLRGRG